MNPFRANLINSLSLIILGISGYFFSENPSHTALIPVLAGVVLLFLSPGIKKHSKSQAHVAVIITTVVLIALIMPLLGSIKRGNESAILRVIGMMLTSAFAMVIFVKSFIDARRSR